jgi:rubrerythrin
MTRTVVLAGIALSLCLGFRPSTQAQTQKKLSPETMQNLSTAMHGEAFAYAKYMAFAERARKSGDDALADLFEKTAAIERFEHFEEEATLAGLVGSDAENLQDAIKGESYETETMYREFSQQAAKAGDHEAAMLFEEIGNDEAKHRDAYVEALKKLQASDTQAPH